LQSYKKLIMNKITVETIVKAPIDKVWACWNEPEHIKNWAFASDDWEVPTAENDLKVGGQLKITMATKDKSQSFDVIGNYNVVEENQLIEFDMADGRRVKVEFSKEPEGTKVRETFDPEDENTEELQRSGWQSILNNFKKYTESKK